MIKIQLREKYEPFEADCEEKFKEISTAHEKFTEEIEKLFDEKADRSELKDILNKINDLLKEVEEALKWKQPLVQVTNRIDKVEIQIKGLIDELRNLPLPASAPEPVKEIIKIQEVREEKPGIDPQVIIDLQNALETKADLSALRDLEKYLLQRLEDLENGLDSRFADKNDTKKALKALEKQIKNLFDILMNQESGQKDEEDDAMFSKRPLGGWSCASCAKDLVNLQGLPAEYLPWSKWPLRDPNERIAKSGQGFSRILSSMKPEYLTQPKFYPNQSLHDGYTTIPHEKLSTKKKKKRMRPMSANRVIIK